MLPYAIALGRLEEWAQARDHAGLPRGLRSGIEGSENWAPTLVAGYLRHSMRAAVGIERKIGILSVFALG
jgi:hypothetical protein